MNIENARIRNTQLGMGDRGLFTMWLHLEYDGAGQGFGGYALDDKPKVPLGHREPTAFAGACIVGILRTLGVDDWENLPGTFVRVKREDGFNGRVTHVGHIMKDRWFSFEETLAATK